ncbi:hypothetical protein HMI55_002133 [Coelomomyces lativittatus]|nr:hypothetical protein HMI55_002133 [Coelomomyces lativittatus]
MMKCIHVNETGGPEVLQLVSKPQPTIEPGHVIVKNAFVGINFIDIYHRTGLYPLPLPFIPGREGAGIIVETSPEVYFQFFFFFLVIYFLYLLIFSFLIVNT